MSFDPTRLTDPQLRQEFAPEIRAAEADERAAVALANRQQKAAETDQQNRQKQAQQQQLKDTNAQAKQGFMQQGRRYFTDGSGRVVPVDSDEAWQAKQALDQSNAKATAQYRQEGRKFHTNPVTGAVEALESDAAIAERRRQAAEALRRSSFDSKIETLRAEAGMRRPPLTDTERRKIESELKETRQNAVFGLSPILNQKASQTTKAGWWDLVNNPPTEEAAAAQARLDRLTSDPDYDPDDNDLAELEADPANAPIVGKLRTLRAQLAEDDEARATAEKTRSTLAELHLRKVNPQRWAELQRQKIAGLDAPALDSLLAESDTGLQERFAAYQEKRTALEASSQAFEQRQQALIAQNQEAARKGIPAGELVTMEDDSTWHRPLAAELMRLQAEAAEQQISSRDAIEALNLEAEDLNREAEIHNEAIARRQSLAQQEQKTARDRLRFSPAGPAAAAALDSLDAEAKQRRATIEATYPEGSAQRQAALDALEADLQTRSKAADTQRQQRVMAASAALDGIRSQIAADPANASRAGELLNAARDNIAQALNIPAPEAQQLIEDLEAAEDFGAIIGQLRAEQRAGHVPGVMDKWGDRRDEDHWRILSTGGLVINPRLVADLDTARKVIEASPASPEAKAAAIAALPDQRRRFGEQALEAFQAYPAARKDFDTWKTKQADDLKNLPAAEQAARYADHLRQSSGPMGRLFDQILRNTALSFVDLGSQALGVAGGITGSETLMAGATGLQGYAAASARMLDYTGANDSFLNRATGQTFRIAGSLVPSLGGGLAARAGTAALASTGFGARFFPTLAAAIRGTATAGQMKRAQQILTTAGLVGASTAGAGQTYGAQLPEIYDTLRKQGLDHKAALKAAQVPAILSATATAILTFGFGATGVEKLLDATAKQAVKSRARNILQGMFKGGVAELPEEIADEMISHVVARVSTGGQIQEALAEFVETLPELSAAVFALGGAGGALSAARAPVQPTDAGVLPEQIAAAWTELENLGALPGIQPTEVDAIQNRASVVLALAQGGTVEDLEEHQLNAAGWTARDKDGRQLPPGQLARLQGYTGPEVLEVSSEGGVRVLPSYRESLLNHLPAVAAAVPEALTIKITQAAAAVPPSEAAPRGSSVTTAAPAAASAGGSVQAPAAASPAAAGAAPAAAAPAPVSTPSGSTQTAPAATVEQQTRAQQIATYLTERGLTREQAQAAADSIVASQGIVGAEYTEQVTAAGFDDAMGAIGWVRGSGKKFVFVPPTDGATPPTTAAAPVPAETAATAPPAAASEDEEVVGYLTRRLVQDGTYTPEQAEGAARRYLSILGENLREAVARFVRSHPHLNLQPDSAEALRRHFLDWLATDEAEQRAAGKLAKGRAAYEQKKGQSAPPSTAAAPQPLPARPQALRRNQAWARERTRTLAGIKDPDQKAKARRILDWFEKAFAGSHAMFDGFAVGSAARAILGADADLTAGILTHQTRDGRLILAVDLPSFVGQHMGFSEDALEREMRKTMQHEGIHIAQLRLAEKDEKFTRGELVKKWRRLPKELRNKVWQSYHAANIASGRLPAQMPAKVDAGQEWQLMSEFLRMLTEDQAFAGEVTEATNGDPSMAQWLLDLLKNLAAELGRLLKLADPELQTDIQSMVTRLGEVTKEMQAASRQNTDRLASLQAENTPGARAIIALSNGTLLNALGKTAPAFKPETLARLWDKLPQGLQRLLYENRRDQDTRRAPKDQLMRDFVALLLADPKFSMEAAKALQAEPPAPKNLLRSLLDNVRSVLRPATVESPTAALLALLQATPKQAGNAILGLMTRAVEAARRLDNVQTTAATSPAPAAPARLDTTLRPEDDEIPMGQDNRRPLLSAAEVNAEPPEGMPSLVTGSTGTAYTDSNDPIEYEWAAVEVTDLNVSNRDDGTVNPAYPQELQPRDRTGAGSEAQVTDIAKNMNLARLSSSSTVGDGAPIIGPDGVVESGNGRIMGMRRGYTAAGSVASSYRDSLIARAADFGLDPAAIRGMKAPVLVRVRRTAVDRGAFVMAANVSTIAPKREIEQARSDAKQIVPDLFESFIANEDGEIFTAANSDFIRGFISTVIPPAERPAIIDLRGNLSQTGLRRIRNALFVHAYGDNKETLNALARLTEDIEADGRNLVNALVALAPRFGDQNARIAAGALRPLSITEDLARALATYQELKTRGESIENWSSQATLAGVDDGPSSLDKSIVQAFDLHRRSARRLMAVLNRYAAGIESLGDPKQAALFGEEPAPTREELWEVAKNATPGPSLPMSSRVRSPQETALKLYRRLKAIEKEKGRLDGTQAQTLERAERALGQSFFAFDDGAVQPDFSLETEIAWMERPTSTEQLRLFMSTRRTPSANIQQEFPAWPYGFDNFGLPNPPRTLPDDSPLLEVTANKETAILQPDHRLVVEGMLPAGREFPRNVLHRAIVAYHFKGKTPVASGETPWAYASGGGGGAGKSTILKLLSGQGRLDTSNAVTVNPDDIKELIPEYSTIAATGDGRAAAVVHEESSRLAKQVLERLFNPDQPRYHFVYDGTLGWAPGVYKQFSEWRRAGYSIHLIGVTVDPQEAAERAAIRGKSSGRWVPVPMLLEAHRGFNANIKSYIDLVDRAEVYDNTPPNPHEVATKSTLKSPISVVNQELWSIIERRKEYGSENPQDGLGRNPSGGTSRGSAALREVQRGLQSDGSPRPGSPPRQEDGERRERRPGLEGQNAGTAPEIPGQQTLGRGLEAGTGGSLSMSRRRADSGTLDLFSFNAGLELTPLLTPAQRDAKLEQALQPSLFGTSSDARPRPTSSRPAKSARPSRPAQPAETAAGFGDLFGQAGLDSPAGGTGNGRRGFGGSSGLLPSDGPLGAGADGVRGNSGSGGTETGTPGTDSAGETDSQGSPDTDVSGMPGDAAGLDADLRPSVGDPARNFEIPEDLESLAPATDKAKIQANIEAIRLLKRLESERRNATTEEKRVLASYTGWGAFKEAFNSKYEQAITEIWDKPGARRQYMPEFLQSWERNHRANHKLLREAMTEDEFASASASTLNAHYTALPIIRSMWSMVQRLGFTGGRALEPAAGAGHYIGTTPAAMADRVQWQAVELDELSARLLSRLYPEATVNEEKGGADRPARQITGLGFERARIPNGSLDLVISNVPFHESGPSKKGFPKLNLHNFFFGHALDKVKPGGLVAFITSESTMQNNIRQRDFLASKGDLVAAIRLPNNAFKENAGTEVTTDILIFRKPDGTPFKGEAWRNLVEVGRQTITLTQRKDQSADEFRREADRTGEVIGKEYWKGDKRALDVSAPIMVNEYFVNHPQHALGQHTLASSMYRAGGYALVAPPGFDVQQALDALIPTLPANIMGRQEAADNRDIRLAGRSDKPFSFKEEDGKIFEVQPDGSMEEAEWSTNPAMVATWRSWRTVADTVKDLVQAETSGSATDAELEAKRRRLNVVYSTHVLRHKPISRRFHNQHKHLLSDPDFPLTAALENEVVTINPKTGKKDYTYRKADIFTKRIGRPIIAPTTATGLDDAVEKSLAWRGRIDPAFAGDLLRISPEAFEAQALQRPDIYRNPATGMLETAEDYLTGNVRVKLMQAEAAQVDDPRMEKNVAALRAAQPPRREISRIAAILGARWIPAEVYNAFIAEVLQGNDTVEYVPAGNSWIISGTNVYATEEHGTERSGPFTTFKHALNMTEPLIYDRSGDSREFNPAETVAAKVALDKMRRAFIEFAKTSETQVTVTNESGESKTSPVWEAVEDAFNETQNSFVDPAHTGNYLTFPGLNTDYVYTRAHRRAVIARFLAVRRGMMAHGVGSGKTFNQIILAHELRRLGLAKKPMIVVQNSTLGQFAASFLKAYPGAKLLVPTKRDFEAQNRRKLVAKIATGDWDAVLLPHSQFDKISNQPSAIKAYMDSQIDELMGIVAKTKDKAKVRDLEGMVKRLQDRRKGMLDALAARQDSSIMWEDLGIDALIMDEAHNYKSLPIVTRMGRVKGVPSSGDSQRAINFMLKVRDVQARTAGKNIFLATGTPIKNSMAEAYIMMQYMAPDVLEQFRIYNFDDFATTYGQTVTEAEMSWGGTPKMETRFAKFQNGPSLVTMIRTMFDVAFGNDKLGLDVPKIKGGEPEMVIVSATEAIDQFNAWTRSVNELWQNADSSEKEEYTAVPIQTMAAGVAAALDPRLISPTLPDDPNSKVNTALKRVLDIYKAGAAKRTTQIIFSDLRNKFSMDYLMPFTGHPFPDYGSDGEFDLYTDMRQKLIAAGIPEKEIHLMKSGLTDKQKEAIFEKVDNGEIRVIIGSTELLGVGVNIQSRLQAVHHLSPPRDFTPAMMEQRNGRIIRQGNLHAAKVDGQPAWDEPVQILNYGTDGSMDSAIYGTLARKQRFITQLLMGDDMGDTFDDPTDPVAVNMAEMAARTLGDPDFIRRIELEREIKELRLQADAYTSELSGKRSRLSRTEAEARTSPGFIARLEAAAESFGKIWTRTAPRPEGVKEETDISDKPVYEFGDQVIDTAGKDGTITGQLDVFLQRFSKALERRGKKYDSTTIKVNGNPIELHVFVAIPGSPTSGEIVDADENPVAKFTSAASLIQQLHRIPEDIRAHVSRSRERIADLQASAERLRALLKEMPPQFPQADRLAALEREAREVDERIRAKAAPPEAAAKPAKDETADLPDMKLVSPGLMTYAVERVIDNADIEGNKLFLPDTLDRKLYQAVNAALEDAGGRWNRKAKAHIFKGDPRPYLGLAPMPDETPALAMSARRGYDGTHEQTGRGPNQLDRRTAASTQIQGSRVTAEQGHRVRDVHFARLIGGPLRQGGPFASPRFDWNARTGSLVRRLSEAFQAPVLTAEQERAIRTLPYNDEGRESTVYLDRENGVIYKRLEDHQGRPSGGIWPHINVTSLNNLNWSFQPLTSPRRLGIRLALLSDIGGTPTEVAAIGRAGHIYLKQPLSPNPKIGRDEAFIDNSGLTIARRRAGIVEIPSRMLPQTAPRAFMAWSHNHAWLVFDLHPDNFIGDNQGQGRINDPVFAYLPPDVLAAVPGLSSIVEQAKSEAARLGDRANRLFKSATTASPMARLGWNNLDRALSAKVAAHTRWVRDTAAGTVAAWRGKPGEERIYGRIEKLLKKEFIPDSVMPREVAAQKREMEIKSAIGSQKAMDLVRALSGNPKFSDLVYPPQFSQNPEWRRRLYMAMTGEESMSALPAELQALAGRLRRILVDIGREAVKQGRMSLDTFENLQSGYMPHYYKEDVQREKSIFQRFRLGVRDILAQRTTAWHIADTSINGPDGQPRLVSWQGNQWRFRNQEHRDAFYEDFILQQALEEITNRNGRQNRNLTLADLRAPAKLPEETQGRLKEILRTLRARYKKERPLSAAEQERAGLIMDPVYAIARYAAQMVHDNSTAEFFNFVAENPAWTSKTASPGFTEIPDNPRFGRLAGRYVVDEIAGQVLELVEVPNQALQAYDTLLSWWKTGKTVLNPGTHVRNVLGNLFFSQIAGASVWNPGNLPFYRDAIRLLRNGGPELLEAYEQGVLGADFVSAELRQTLRQLLPDPQTIQDDGGANVLLGIGKAIGKVLPGWARNPLHTTYNKITSLYQAEDEVFKLAAYLKAKAMLEDGAPDSAERRAAAAAHVRKWFPYYDLSDSGTIKAAKRTFMPFMAFYRESIRIFGTALAERPLGLAAGLAFPSLITYLSALVLGLDDDELEQVRRDMRGKAGKLLGPTPIEGAPIFSMLLPLRSDTGALQQWDIAAVHPFADFLGNRVEAAEGQDWYQQWWRSMLAAGPLGSLIYAQMTGRDAFGDRTFVEQNMSGGEKLAARADNAAKILLPPVLPGGTAFATLANAGTRTTNKTFELRSPTQAVLRAVAGVDVRNATPDLYRIADDWRQAQGLPTSEGMDYGSTPASRARKALFAVLAQDKPNLTAVKNITAKLKAMGQPVETPQDIQRLLFYRNPLMVIRGADNQQRFRASLSGLERQALDDAVREYERIKARAPALIRAARAQ